MGGLVKEAIRTEVTPFVPPAPAVPPIACMVFAPALPRGWKYRAPPTTGEAFDQWAARYQVMLSSSAPTLTTVFVPLYAWSSYPYDPVSQSFTARTDSEGELIGFWVTTTTYVGELYPDTLNYWYTEGVTHIQFDDWFGDGPPPGPVGGTYTGKILRWPYLYTAQFTKDSDGFMRATSDFDMPYSVTRRAHGIAAIINDPGRAARPAQRAVVDTDYLLGWNAGAESESELDGDVRVVFEPAIVAAGAVGLTNGRTDVTDPEALSHAFYFDADPAMGFPRFCIVERGRRVSAFWDYYPAASFTIRREGTIGQVTYEFDGEVMHTSVTPLYSAVRVGTSLYRAGDGVL